MEEIDNTYSSVLVAYCIKILDLRKTNPFKKQNA